MPFAAPVMAERAHVAERAQLSSVRRRATESGARTLGEAVSAHLRSHNVDPGAAEWDAWRREDGRWTLTALYEVAGRTGTGTFSYDPRGNFVTVDDDDARWLVGDATSETSAGADEGPAADDLSAARQRRLSAVGVDEPALGDDAIELASDGESATETTMELGTLGETPGAEQPIDPQLEDEPAASAGKSADEPETEEPADRAPEPRRPAKKRGRASVPSWDEIMFGGGKND
jgi:hypothetical protein